MAVAVAVAVCGSGCPHSDPTPPAIDGSGAGPAPERVEFNEELRVEARRYEAEKATDWPAACRIAKDVASAHTGLWEKCGRGYWYATHGEQAARRHFASAYFQRGPQKEDELISLLHSGDEKLLVELLPLLGDCGELTPDGAWRHGKPSLGGPDVARHVAQVYESHPTLAMAVVGVLHSYRSAAKGEIPTLLRIALKRHRLGLFMTKAAIGSVDPDAYARFGLDPIDAPLTGEQRAAIEDYLASLPPSRDPRGGRPGTTSDRPGSPRRRVRHPP